MQLWVPMDVAESPERDPRSPEDEEEEQQGLSDDDILRESGSDQDLDKAAGRASDLEDEENAALGLSQEEEESRSDEEDQDQDSEPQELNRGPTSPPHAEEGDGGEEDRTSDLRDEASSVTRELDEHELDYDEEVPEEPAPTGQEDEAEKAGAEEDEEKGEGAPEEEGKADVHSVEEKEPLEAAKEKKKEDDDGEIDDGEIDDDDLEEGEVKDPSDRKVRPRPTCRFFMKACVYHLKFTRASCTSFPDVVTPLSTLLPPISNSIPFRDQVKGNCTWGMNCRFIHPGVNDKGNYSLITKAEPFPPNGAPPLGPHPLMPANPWGGPVVDEILPPPPPEPPTESAWERGLRHAKEVLKKATIRKEQEPDFEEKRFTVTIGEDEREFDKENEVFRDWNYRITRDVRDTTRQAEPPKKEAVSAGPQVKRADEWKDPWRRSKSPKKKLGVSVSPSRARRRRKTSASSASASNSSRSSSRSSSYSGSGSSRSRSRSSSYSSYSSRSSRHSSFSGSQSRSRSFSSSPSPSPTPSPHRPSVRTKGEPALPPGKAGEKMVKKPAPPPAPPQAPKTTAPTPEPAKPGDPREARRRERQARTPPRRRTISGSGSGSSYSGSSSRSRSLSVSSVSSVSSATSSSSSVHSVDSEDMYADLASPVSSASSRSPTPAQTKKEKAGKSKKEDGVKEDKRKRDSSTQPPKSSKSSTGSKSSQQPTTPQQAPSGQPQQGTFVAHKEIKLTLLNKAADKGSRKRYEPSDKDRLSPPPAKRANLSPDRGSRDRKSGGRLGSPKPERQRGQNSKAPVALPDRKRQLSPQSKSSSKVTSVPGKASDAGTAASTGTKSGKASTLSRREELLKQLKAVEDAIARKRAKIPGKV
ncbi:zinc finger CCCH domain-containing protein 18 isoform X8 [Myotis lucifugus]|uniref:zinc finger CCCH domain-containing protein 18 isoform X8 n=1 Tax=Myotis lucifugus TaxID=59463 RepID=UPI000CCC7FFB|nr:zinc finger CCCH domain-containing protein 18 isoform X8 [Myotis lucifugus]